MVSTTKIRLGAQASCLHSSMYCCQDGGAPGHIFIIVCEHALTVSAPKMAWERRHLACILPCTAARMGALPGTFSLLRVSVAHGIYYENTSGSAGILPACFHLLRPGRPLADPDSHLSLQKPIYIMGHFLHRRRRLLP